MIPPGDGQDGVFREDPDLAVQPDEGQDSVLRGDNWGDFVPEGDGDGGGDDLPDRIPPGDGEEEDFGELIEDGGVTVNGGIVAADRTGMTARYRHIVASGSAASDDRVISTRS